MQSDILLKRAIRTIDRQDVIKFMGHTIYAKWSPKEQKYELLIDGNPRGFYQTIHAAFEVGKEKIKGKG